MSIIKHIISTLILSLLLPISLGAQFYVTGDDPGRAKWYTIDTDNFSIIYPEGTDSLARSYGYKLEKYRLPVSRSTGYLNKGRMPVVLHAYNGANGSVAWAPQRMDMFTIPSAYDPEPLPWSTMLSVHEGRHVTQMQFGMTESHRPISWAFGEMWNILASVLYPGMANIEGDAVVAETALTKSGRGRTADFLNYYRVAFDNGDFRTWAQWRYDSQRRYAPDYYALGYMHEGGLRYFHDYPMHMYDGYRLAARKPHKLFAFRSVAEKTIGKSNEDIFQEICRNMHDLWKEEDEKRAPFIPMEPVSAEPRLYSDYQGTIIVDSTLYSIKSGYETTPVLVKIDKDGNESFISSFAYRTSGLKASESLDRIYWSETLPDTRWSLESASRIRYIDIDGSGKHTLRPVGQHLLYNPDINPTNNFIANIGYGIDGSSSLTVMNGINGDVIKSIGGPSGVQLVETAWSGEDLLASGITDDGFGVWKYSDNTWSVVLAPQPVKIKDFKAYGNEIIFTCDRTGVNELYHLDPATGNLRQKTVTRYGASDFAYDENGEYLYYSSQTLKGMTIFRTAVEDLVDREVDFSQKYRWVVADALAQQEKALAQAQGFDEAVTDIEVNFSEPRRYRKIPHMFNVHSWAPVYVNVDNIMNMSFDNIWQAASLGATAIMQNRLSNASGEFGYSAHKDPYDPSKWRHSGHFRFLYSGLYPVFEVEVDFNDRAARQYTPVYYVTGKNVGISLGSRTLDVPYVEGKFTMYIPWNLSSGGWYRGFIPKLTYRVSNDMFNTGASVVKLQDSFYSDLTEVFIEGGFYEFWKSLEGKNTFRHSLSGSLRAYTALSTPNSSVYPRWGIGVEAGASGGLESSGYISPMGYGYIYGYVPGLIRTHGVKLTAMHQMKLSDTPFGQAVINAMPRGLNNNMEMLSWLATMNTQMSKVTADYAFPVYLGDISIGDRMFSLKRLVVNTHFDYTFAGGYGLFSAGAELILDLNCILAIEWPCSVGLTYSYNGGNGFDALSKQSGISLNRNFIGPTFNVSF